eukprot:9319526-Pyramimonas_sp.AAC.1
MRGHSIAGADLHRPRSLLLTPWSLHCHNVLSLVQHNSLPILIQVGPRAYRDKLIMPKQHASYGIDEYAFYSVRVSRRTPKLVASRHCIHQPSSCPVVLCKPWSICEGWGALKRSTCRWE